VKRKEINAREKKHALQAFIDKACRASKKVALKNGVFEWFFRCNVEIKIENAVR